MNPADMLAVSGMLVMGTIKTLLNKLMYSIKARGIDGTVHSFEARAPPRVTPPRPHCAGPREAARPVGGHPGRPLCAPGAPGR